MSERKRTESLLKRFEAAEKDAIEGVLRRIGKTEAKIAVTVGKIPRSLGRELDSIRGRLEDARRSAEDRVEEFRSKLMDGPLTEEELRARLLILEMEYASRVRLAEQGFDLLAERFEDHVASGRHWLTDVCDQVRQAVRIDVKPVRAQLGDALIERSRALAARERELDGLRQHRDAVSPFEARISELENKNRILEAKLKESQSDTEVAADIKERLEARTIELTREVERFKNENADLTIRLGNVEGEADTLLDQLRDKEGEKGGDEKTVIEQLRDTITPLLDERLGLRNRIKTLEERVEALKKSATAAAGLLERLREREHEEHDSPADTETLKAKVKEVEGQLAEKDVALGGMLKELSGFRDAAGRFRERFQTVELELAAAKAELKEMRQERRGLVERYNAASQARDVERKRAEKAEKAETAPKDSESKSDPRVAELKMKLAAAARGLIAVREKVTFARERIKELEARAVPEKDRTLDIDAEKADLAQRVEGKGRENEELAQELKKKSSALEAAQKAWVSMRSQMVEAQKRAAGVVSEAAQTGVPADLQALREEVTTAKTEAADVSEQLATERKSAKMMQKRLFEADVARDRALSETRAQWADEQEAYEEQLSEKNREASMLKTRLETTEQSWQETLARQDGERMQEIFKLRAEIQKLKWKLEEKEEEK